MTRPSRIDELQAQLHAARCDDADLPGGAFWLAPPRPIFLVKAGAIDIDQLVSARPGAIIPLASGLVSGVTPLACEFIERIERW